MIRFYFIRHADAYDEMGLQLDHYPLNNYGKVQAIQLARRLKDNHFDVMYCSKIQRAIDTCEIVNESHKMKIHYLSDLNEVGTVNWPQPGALSTSEGLDSFGEAVNKIHRVFKDLIKKSEKANHKEVIIFTHGNWIRVLLSKILSNGNSKSFTHFVIHNTSLTIIDVDDSGYQYIITVADAAHTQLFRTVI